MKPNHLRVVTDNAPRVQRAVTPTVAAQIDFQLLLARGRYSLTMIGLILMLPFRFVATVGRIAVATGVGFLQGVVKLALGILGLALIGMVCFGLIRVIFHPLFH